MLIPARAVDGVTKLRPELRKVNALIGELIAALEEENRLLAAGLPASLTTTTGAKLRLATAVEAEMKAVFGAKARIKPTAVEREILAARVARTQELASENAARLAGAIEASRRRIAAIVSAVREECYATAPAYGANGRRPAGRGRENLSSGVVI